MGSNGIVIFLALISIYPDKATNKQPKPNIETIYLIRLMDLCFGLFLFFFFRNFLRFCFQHKFNLRHINRPQWYPFIKWTQDFFIFYFKFKHVQIRVHFSLFFFSIISQVLKLAENRSILEFNFFFFKFVEIYQGRFQHRFRRERKSNWTGCVIVWHFIAKHLKLKSDHWMTLSSISIV